MSEFNAGIAPTDIEDRSDFVCGAVGGFLLSALVTIVSYHAVFTPMPKPGSTMKSIVNVALSHDLRILGYPMLVGGPILVIVAAAFLYSLYINKSPKQPLVAMRYVVRLLVILIGDFALPYFLLQHLDPQIGIASWGIGVISIIWAFVWTMLVGFMPIKPPKAYRKD